MVGFSVFISLQTEEEWFKQQILRIFPQIIDKTLVTGHVSG